MILRSRPLRHRGEALVEIGPADAQGFGGGFLVAVAAVQGLTDQQFLKREQLGVQPRIAAGIAVRITVRIGGGHDGVIP